MNKARAFTPVEPDELDEGRKLGERVQTAPCVLERQQAQPGSPNDLTALTDPGYHADIVALGLRGDGERETVRNEIVIFSDEEEQLASSHAPNQWRGPTRAVAAAMAAAVLPGADAARRTASASLRIRAKSTGSP